MAMMVMTVMLVRPGGLECWSTERFTNLEEQVQGVMLHFAFACVTQVEFIAMDTFVADSLDVGASTAVAGYTSMNLLNYSRR
jgi:hypothetical protein